MAYIEKRGKKWRVRWDQPDGTPGSITLNTEKEAQRLRLEIEDTVRTGKRWRPRDVRPVPTLGQAMTAYQDSIAQWAKPKTMLNVAYILSCFTRFVGDTSKVKVSDLSVDMLARFYAWLGDAETSRHGSVGRSLDSRRKYVGTIAEVWRWLANSDDFVDFVPPARSLEKLPSDPQKPTRAPTWEEMDAAIAHAAPWYPLPMAIMRATGLRVSQVMRLHVRDVDVHAKLLRFRGELGKSKQERRGREVPIAPEALWLFEALVKDKQPEDWLVPPRPTKRRGDRRQVRTRRVRDAWASTKVREDVYKLRPDHAFRKGFTTGLRKAGAEKDAVEFLIGHSLGLSGVYTDADAYDLRRAVLLVPAFGAPARSAIERSLGSKLHENDSGETP